MRYMSSTVSVQTAAEHFFDGTLKPTALESLALTRCNAKFNTQCPYTLIALQVALHIGLHVAPEVCTKLTFALYAHIVLFRLAEPHQCQRGLFILRSLNIVSISCSYALK